MAKSIRLECIKCKKARHLDENNVKQIEKKYGSLDKANKTYLCRTCKKANKKEE
jgi:hypothetical protein